MTVFYNGTTINSRLQAVINNIDANGPGFINLFAGGIPAAQFQLQVPSGTVAGGILTFAGLPLTAPALVNGNIGSANITDALGTVVGSGLTVSTSTNTDIVMANTAITLGQTLALTVATITGS